MRYEKINSKLFIDNRKRFAEQMQNDSIAIFNANDELFRNGDVNYIYRQNSNLFYFSGIEQPKTILVIFPNCEKEDFREVLFVEQTNENIEIWHGKKLSKKQVTEISGVKTVKWISEFDTFLSQVIPFCQNIYINLKEEQSNHNNLNNSYLYFFNSIREQYPLHNYKRSAPIVQQLRLIKSDIEIELIKTAIAITRKAFERVVKFIKPNVKEYQIQAEIEHEFTNNGATGHAYQPIIASGKNSCILHYIDNNDICKDGDLVLLDFGAEYANYASDLSRTIPVNGKFNKRQKDVYDAVARTQKSVIKEMVVGTNIDEINQKTNNIITNELISLNLLSKSEVSKNKNAFKKYFMHGTSHFMGLDVHDLGTKQTELKQGMILTCEPAIYIKEEGIGIRLENDILITNQGPIDLMKDIPFV